MIGLTLVLLVSLAGSSTAATRAGCPFPVRVSDSPYPLSAIPSVPNNTLTLFDGSSLSTAQLLTLQSLQGLLSRESPTLFEVAGASDCKTLWANDLTTTFGVHTRGPFSFTTVLSMYLREKKSLSYVLCDISKTTTVTTALAYAAVGNDSIVVDVTQEPVLQQLGFSKAADATDGSISSASLLAAHPLGKSVLSSRLAVLQSPAKSTFLSDWSSFSRSFTWWDTTGSLPSPLSRSVLSQLSGPAAILGWGPTEGDTVGQLSAAGAFIHAADFANNLATLSAFAVPCQLQPHSSVPKPSTTTPAAVTPNKHTVSFLMTDGDNIQWLLNSFASSPSWFGSPQRGSIPMGWTMSPAMAELAPTVLDYFYRKGVPGKDQFVAGPSGVGYMYPESLPNSGSGDLKSFTNLTASVMEKADLNIVNILANEQCHPDCTTPFLSHDSISSAFLYYGNAYVGGGGQIYWIGDKPVVTGRTAFWQGFNTVQQLVTKLRALPTDIGNPNSFSLIPVHVWSRNYSDVVEVVKMLGDEFFDVLPPEDFVAKLKAEVWKDCDSTPKASGSFSQSCSGGSDSCGVLHDFKCSVSGSLAMTTPFFDHTVCPGNIVSNCHGRLICQGTPCQTLPAPTGSYAGSCSGCSVSPAGVLFGCKCSGPAGQTKPLNFDYSVCPQLSVANCDGNLICQGLPC